MKVVPAVSLLMIGALILAGCANPPGRPGAAAGGANLARKSGAALSVADLPAATYIGSIKRDINYSGQGITLNIPLASDTPTTSWTAAYANCLTGDAVCQVGVAPVISLALVTTKNAGEHQPDGSTKPLLNNTLAYVLQWSNEPCVPTGGPPVQGTNSPAPRPTSSCTVLNFVDADSSKVVYSVEGPDF